MATFLLLLVFDFAFAAAVRFAHLRYEIRIVRLVRVHAHYDVARGEQRAGVLQTIANRGSQAQIPLVPIVPQRNARAPFTENLGRAVAAAIVHNYH